MISRRAFLATVAGGLLAAPLVAEAQQAGKVPRVGLYVGAEEYRAAFRQGMRELGYAEGRNVTILYGDRRSGDDPAVGLATLLRQNVDVLVTGGDSTIRAAANLTSTVPIVMSSSGDPVGNGFAKSLAKPGGNLTGLSNYVGELAPKRVEILTSAIPKLTVLGVLSNPGNPTTALQLSSTEKAAKALGLRMRSLEVHRPGEIGAALAALARDGVGGVVILGDPMLASEAKHIADAAAAARLPTMGFSTEFTVAGGLMAYGVSFGDLFRRAAAYVDKILKGAKPADLPIEQPTKFELVINLKTAKALGLTIPPSLLQRADEVIHP